VLVRSITKRTDRPLWRGEAARRTNRRFEFHKRRQLFFRPCNETLSVVAVRINNPDCSPVGINR
jgi:hypothetical protein